MPESRILVATGPLDATAEFVIEELNRRHVPLTRIDTGAFPDTVNLSATFGPDGWRGELSEGARSLRLENLRAVYWRRPSAFPAQSVAAGPSREFASREARAGMGGVLYSLPDVVWVNRPYAITACTKPAQLVAFSKVGLSVPDSWIGNVPESHGAFCEAGPAVSKTLGPITYGASDGGAVLYASHVPPEHYGHARARATANYLQREIGPKTIEYRVAVVGDRLFICEVHSSVPYLDIRAAGRANVTYTPGTLPGDVQTAILGVTRGFGLVFAAWDLIEDDAGTIWALELNPSGQWAFTPDKDDICRAIADYLEEAAST